MDKRMRYQDNPIQFYLLTARVVGFLVTAFYMLFIVPEFIFILNAKNSYSEAWIYLFYAISILYGLAYLLTYWKITLGAILYITSSLFIIIFTFLDTKSWIVFFLFVPLSLAGVLFLLYWKKNKYHRES